MDYKIILLTLSSILILTSGEEEDHRHQLDPEENEILSEEETLKALESIGDPFQDAYGGVKGYDPHPQQQYEDPPPGQELHHPDLNAIRPIAYVKLEEVQQQQEPLHQHHHVEVHSEVGQRPVASHQPVQGSEVTIHQTDYGGFRPIRDPGQIVVEGGGGHGGLPPLQPGILPHGPRRTPEEEARHTDAVQQDRDLIGHVQEAEAPNAGHILDYSSGAPYHGNFNFKPYSNDYTTGVNINKGRFIPDPEPGYPGEGDQQQQQHHLHHPQQHPVQQEDLPGAILPVQQHPVQQQPFTPVVQEPHVQGPPIVQQHQQHHHQHHHRHQQQPHLSMDMGPYQKELMGQLAPATVDLDAIGGYGPGTNYGYEDGSVHFDPHHAPAPVPLGPQSPAVQQLAFGGSQELTFAQPPPHMFGQPRPLPGGHIGHGHSIIGHGFRHMLFGSPFAGVNSAGEKLLGLSSSYRPTTMALGMIGGQRGHRGQTGSLLFPGSVTSGLRVPGPRRRPYRGAFNPNYGYKAAAAASAPRPSIIRSPFKRMIKAIRKSRFGAWKVGH